MPVIEIVTEIKAERKICFDLSRSIDLHQISVAHTKEQSVSGKTSGLIGLDEWVTWKAKHFGFWFTLTSKITAYKRPEFFTDEMTKGIFRSMKHQHVFKEKGVITEMIDIFEYESPLGILGRFVDQVFLKRYLTNLLKSRNQIIKIYAESGRWKDMI